MKQRQCQYTKDDLTKCTSFAMNGSDFCYRHNPDISNEEKLNASSKVGSHSPLSLGEEGWGGEVSLPEMKMENLRDVANSLADSINQVRTGKISPKTGGTLAYMSFVLYMIMDKAKAEEKQEKIDKLKAEGKYRPKPTYGGKHYFYKDDFYLDKDGNPLIVERDSINGKEFKKIPGKKTKRKVKSKVIIDHSPANGESEKDFEERTMKFLKLFKEGQDMRKEEEEKKEEEENST